MAYFLLSFLSNSNRKTQKSSDIGLPVYVLWKGNEFFPARKTDNDDAFSNVACKGLLPVAVTLYIPILENEFYAKIPLKFKVQNLVP